MSAARRSDGDSNESFADAVKDSGVEPLAGRDERVTRQPGTARAAVAQPPTRFDFPDEGEPLLGIAAGIQTSQLRKLRSGRIRPEGRIDLHGLTGEAARRTLLDSLGSAIEAGERCLLVVHGKGLRSKGDPVLRAALPSWLADPRLAGRVLAFAPATPEDGGRGATYVLLRR